MEIAMESPEDATVETTRFGTVTFTENDVIDFPWGLPGFSNLHRFLALTLDEQPNFVWLQSLDDPKMALPAADPWRIFSDYDPRFPAYAVETLELRGASDFTVLCVIVVTKDAEELTMNLMAPIVVNLRTNRARQVMLENSNYSVRAAIPRKRLEAQGAAQPA